MVKVGIAVPGKANRQPDTVALAIIKPKSLWSVGPARKMRCNDGLKPMSMAEVAAATISVGWGAICKPCVEGDLREGLLVGSENADLVTTAGGPLRQRPGFLYLSNVNGAGKSRPLRP